jgi:hypothetical protein
MNRLVEHQPDVRQNQIYRETLLAQPAEFFRPYCGGQVPDLMQKIHLVECMIQTSAAPKVFVNDIYRVQVRQEPPFVHLNICRLDGQPYKNWKDFQTIKNELVGPEYEAVELFPAESRLVDMDNEYHLWVNTQPGYRFPIGYTTRLVLEKPIVYGESAPAGAGQSLTVDSGAVLARQ